MHKFDDIASPALRAYNRAAVMSNLIADSGKAAAEDYMEGFSKQDREHIYRVVTLAKTMGKKDLIAKITKGMRFAD